MVLIWIQDESFLETYIDIFLVNKSISQNNLFSGFWLFCIQYTYQICNFNEEMIRKSKIVICDDKYNIWDKNTGFKKKTICLVLSCDKASHHWNPPLSCPRHDLASTLPSTNRDHNYETRRSSSLWWFKLGVAMDESSLSPSCRNRPPLHHEIYHHLVMYVGEVSSVISEKLWWFHLGRKLNRISTFKIMNLRIGSLYLCKSSFLPLKLSKSANFSSN